MTTLSMYSSDDAELNARFRIENDRAPVVGDALIVGNTRWVLQSGGIWRQDPLTGVQLEKRRR